MSSYPHDVAGAVEFLVEDAADRQDRLDDVGVGVALQVAQVGHPPSLLYSFRRRLAIHYKADAPGVDVGRVAFAVLFGPVERM